MHETSRFYPVSLGYALVLAGALLMSVASRADEAPVSTESEESTTVIDQDSEGGQSGEAANDDDVTVTHVERRERREEEGRRGTLRSEQFGFKPQAGYLSAENLAGESVSKAAIGFLFEANAIGGLGSDAGKAYVGPSVGVFYSHLGSPGSNFLGLDGANGRDSGLDYLFIPLNAKLGWTVGDGFRLSAHGGANLNFRRSSGASDGVDAAGASRRRNDWTANPNLGADIEFALGSGASMMIRPDWTFGSNTSEPVFIGTVGIGFPLG